MDLRLTGTTALVTGSTGGIGRAIAEALAREGATVIVNGRSEDRVAAAVGEIDGAVGLVADLATEAGTAAAIERYPELDILVNNLGIFPDAPFFEEPDDTWRQVLEVNVLSGARLARHYLKGMLERGTGRVIFIASEAAIMPPAEMASYSGSKAMQLSLSRSLADLTKGTAVTVNTVMPGTTKTEGVIELVQGLYPDLSVEEAGRRFVREERATSLIQRLIEPEEIGNLVAFVASPLAGAINGAALRADGGIVHHLL
jgi:3-oxoacyl-[acyl-carrier protein] reductase